MCYGAPYKLSYYTYLFIINCINCSLTEAQLVSVQWKYGMLSSFIHLLTGGILLNYGDLHQTENG